MSLRVILAGFGWWGQHLLPRLRGQLGVEVVGLCAPELETSHHDGVACFQDFEQALDGCSADAVILATPNHLHGPQLRAAAARGLHVFCEKPLSLSADEAREMAAIMSSAGLVLGIGHERRFEPAMQRIADWVHNGDLGTILHTEAAFSHDKLAGLAADNWRTRPETAPAAGMTGMGIHLTDFMIWMIGPVKTVQGLTARRELAWETGDVVTVQLGFHAGMTATLSALLATPHFIRYHVFGSRAWAETRSDTHPDTPGRQSHLVLQRSGAEAVAESFDWTDAVVANLAAFGEACAGGKSYPFTIAQIVHNIEVLEAIAESARTRETVTLVNHDGG